MLDQTGWRTLARYPLCVRQSAGGAQGITSNLGGLGLVTVVVNHGAMDLVTDSDKTYGHNQ